MKFLLWKLWIWVDFVVDFEVDVRMVMEIFGAEDGDKINLRMRFTERENKIK